MRITKQVGQNSWAVVYDKAIRENGSLFFPEKLSQAYLDSQKKSQGSYIYAHQYMNEIIPSEDQDFKKEWLKYYDHLPEKTHTFAMIDPAISLDQDACYTAVVIVDVDIEGQWYLRLARRVRITATQTVKLIFDINEKYKPKSIGVESVAYQMALMHFIAEKMRHEKNVIPVHAVKRGPTQSKGMRIRSLVPRFEWQRILVKQGLHEFEDEYLKFPRGSYVDILDALSSIEEIAFSPQTERKVKRELTPHSPGYEQQYIRNLYKKEGQAS